MRTLSVRGSARKTRIDNEDYAEAFGYSWRLHEGGYVCRNTTIGKRRNGTRRGKIIYLHRQVMGFPSTQVDHIDRDKFNNQKSNLRKANNSQNHFNAPKRKMNNGKIPSSKYKGVVRVGIYKKTGLPRFAAFQNKTYLGYFSSEILAALAYDKAVKKACPRFALTNF